MEPTFTLQCISTTSTRLQWHLFKTASSAAASGAAASGAAASSVKKKQKVHNK